MEGFRYRLKREPKICNIIWKRSIVSERKRGDTTKNEKSYDESQSEEWSRLLEITGMN